MKQTIALAAVLAAVALPASAEYTVKGSVECPDIVKEDANENYREYNKWWLLGYLTARNYAADLIGPDANVAKGIESDELYARALAFCRENPDSDWDDAAVDLFDRLTGEAGGAPSETPEQGGSDGFPKPAGSGGSDGFPAPKAD